MRLTKQTGYALRILIHCGQAQGKLVKVPEIARAYQITEHNLFKIIPLLVQRGVLETVRGRGGGIRLARPAKDIRLGEVVKATEETRIEADCLGGDIGACPIRPIAPINRILDEAISAFIDVLEQYTLEDLVTARPKPRAEAIAALSGKAPTIQ
ncbi:Rrf2 family transcriptional regulator [Lutibaculum baratangense]|uniref:Iron-responsive repressor RirA n=1 Tax=Lutibaculum baratangense AMV1 TaxID=631454 RepID=V4REX1_9HYPH|nr:Rrf2 family transcriptional regulator [Lutibaculum baratangense]ESR23894.1 Iron-responsive repressor RirA [Lutibaculum baratangense AMV1]